MAGSATLDRGAKAKLEKALKGSKCDPPLRTVTLEGPGVSLTVRTKRQVGAPANERTTLAAKVAHRAVAAKDVLAAAAAALRDTKPRLALVFVTSASGLKVRPVAEGLGALGDARVLNDELFPSSQRGRRRGYTLKSAAEKKALEAAEEAMDARAGAAFPRRASRNINYLPP